MTLKMCPLTGILGTSLVDGLRLFFTHDQTEGIIVIGEIGAELSLMPQI